VGLFEEASETPPKRDRLRTGIGTATSLVDWLVRRAEVDLGLAQAFAEGETQRADQIKRLEVTLVGQITALQHQIIAAREAEFQDLRTEISACSDRVAAIEVTAADAAKDFVQEQLSALGSQLTIRQTELEKRYAGFERLGETFGVQLQAIDEHIRKDIDGVGAVQAELHHWKSEAQSLDERVGQAESTARQTQRVVAHHAQQFQESAANLSKEIVSLRAFCGELNQQQRAMQVPNSALKEITENLRAKIEEISSQVAREQDQQGTRDTRLDYFDRTLRSFTERLTNAESESRKSHALLASEASSVTEFRAQVAKELAALHSKIKETQERLLTMDDLESKLRAKFGDWQQSCAQKFMLLENRYVEQEKWSKDAEARRVEHEARTAGQLRAFGDFQEKLGLIAPEISGLTKRIDQLESAGRAARSAAEADANRVGYLEQTLKDATGELRAEIAAVQQQQRVCRLPDEEFRELEHKLQTKIGDLERQILLEREGLEHWNKGLRESFGSELSAIQARLSERQSEIEYRYSRIEERLGETLQAAMVGMESKLTERSQPQENYGEQLATLRSELGTLGERTGRLESQERQSRDRAAASNRDFENRLQELRGELVTSKSTVDHSTGDGAVARLEESLHTGLSRLEGRINEKLSGYEKRESDHAERTAAIIDSLQVEQRLLKARFDQQQCDLPSPDGLIRRLEENLERKLSEVERKIGENLSALDRRDLESVRRADETIAALQGGIEALQGEMSALQAAVAQRAEITAAPVVSTVEESVAAIVQELREELTRRQEFLHQQDSDRIEKIERLVAGFNTEMSAFRGDLATVSGHPSDVPLHALEESLNAKIHTLHQQLAHNVNRLEVRDAELRELNERSESLIQRVAQLSNAMRVPQPSEPASIHTLAPHATELGTQEAEATVNRSQSTHPSSVKSEKEQLVKLQERMSAEIERVRVELKERSGRWKVRRSAS
jgi:chromosome segregation ATPase